MKFKKKTPKTEEEKMIERLLKGENDSADKFLYWIVAALAIVVFIWFLTTDVSAQTISRNYSGSLKVRIDGANPGEKLPCDMYAPGGGFFSQNWAVCNTWSAYSVSAGRVSVKVSYSTSFPSLAAATKGIKDFVNAIAYIKLHADEFGIDTNQIYVWGTSAGGFCAMGVYMYKVKVAGVVNGWGGVLQKSYCTQNNVPVFNISTDYDSGVPVNCGNAFGVQCCGSAVIYEELQLGGIKTDWLVFEGYKHGLRPKDAGYNQRIEDCFTKAINFFNDK